jgi:hypothetical protein
MKMSDAFPLNRMRNPDSKKNPDAQSQRRGSCLQRKDTGTRDGASSAGYDL